MCLVLFLPVQSLITCFKSSLTRFADFVPFFRHYITLPQTVRLFYVSLHSQAPQQQYTAFPFLWCEGMATVTNWLLHVHGGITLWVYLSQTHRPIALHCMHYGITLWAYLSEPLVKDSYKRLSLTEKPACSKSWTVTLTHARQGWKWLPTITLA